MVTGIMMNKAWIMVHTLKCLNYDWISNQVFDNWIGNQVFSIGSSW